MKPKEKYVLDMIKDFKFKGLRIPDITSCNLPSSIPDFQTVTITRDKFIQFRNSYDLMARFIWLITNGQVYTEGDMFSLLMDEARGRIEVCIRVKGSASKTARTYET